MTLSGQFPVVVVIRFALDSAVKLEHGVDADFPDFAAGWKSSGKVDSDFALLFAAAQFALDGDVSPFESVPATSLFLKT